MQAWILDESPGAYRRGEIALPPLGRDDVQIRVRASALNHMDLWVTKGKPSMLGMASGIVAGLVAVTPAAGFAGPVGALLLGLVVGPVCLFACSALKSMLGYDDALDVFGIRDLFQAIVCAEDYERGKPHPEPFLLAAKLMSVAPEDCVVFEDSLIGIEAAKAANMAWVHVPGPMER